MGTGSLMRAAMEWTSLVSLSCDLGFKIFFLLVKPGLVIKVPPDRNLRPLGTPLCLIELRRVAYTCPV